MSTVLTEAEIVDRFARYTGLSTTENVGALIRSHEALRALLRDNVMLLDQMIELLVTIGQQQPDLADAFAQIDALWREAKALMERYGVREALGMTEGMEVV